MANPFLVLGGIAVGLVVATFGVLQVPGWVASAQDAAAINDLSNLNQAQAIHMNTSGMFSAEITALSGGAEAAGFGLEAPVTTLAMSDMALASADDYGIAFKLSDGVTLKHLGTTDEGDAYCAVVQSASGRFFASTSTKTISDASETGLAAMNDAECITEARGDYTGLEPGVPGGEPPAPPTVAQFTIDTTAAGCTTPGLTLGTVAPTATIDWGDKTTSAAIAKANVHTYATPGRYVVTLDGTIPAFGAMAAGTAPCIISMDKWGAETGTTSAASMFQNATNLVSVATPPKTVENMSAMFHTASSFNQDISKWDVSAVKDMSFMFMRAATFNQDLSSWKTDNAITMSRMFQQALAFRSDLSKWNVEKVTDFSYMFSTMDYNQPIGEWKTNSATKLEGMFTLNKTINQDLSGWNMSKVTTIAKMFEGASAFNGKLAWKDTSSLTLANRAFFQASAFNQDLASWNVSKVTTMQDMFNSALVFQGSLAGWQTTSLANVQNMFYYAAKFNQDLTGWNVSKVSAYSYFNTNSGLAQPNVPAKIWQR